jgi:hypothetical protein
LKFSTAIIALSLAANLALAVRWTQQSHASALAPVAPVPVRSPSTTSPAPAIAAQAAPPGSDDPTLRVANLLDGAWGRIQSENLKEYVARLRAIGCPEETVQDIIVAEVHRLFAARQRAINPEPMETEWWKARDWDTEANRDRSRKYRELAAEESAMLIDLLGVDPTKSRRESDGFFDYRDSQLAFLPESKRDAARKLIEDFDEKRQEVSRRNGRIYDSQTRSEQHALEQDQLTALSQILSPEELRQWKLRNSQTATQLQYEISSLNLTEDQYQKLFDVRDKYGDSIYNWAGNSPDEAAAANAAKAQMQKDVQAALGPDLSKDYERSQDYQYKQLTSLAKKYDLPADTASKVYDVKTAAEDAVKKINADTSLNTDDRQAALQAVRDETETAVKSQLGDKSFSSYQKNGGWWLNNLAPRRNPRPPAASQ